MNRVAQASARLISSTRSRNQITRILDQPRVVRQFQRISQTLERYHQVSQQFQYNTRINLEYLENGMVNAHYDRPIGNLQSYLQDPQFTSEHKADILVQLADSLKELHQDNFRPPKISSENVLIFNLEGKNKYRFTPDLSGDTIENLSSQGIANDIQSLGALYVEVIIGKSMISDKFIGGTNSFSEFLAQHQLNFINHMLETEETKQIRIDDLCRFLKRNKSNIEKYLQNLPIQYYIQQLNPLGDLANSFQEQKQDLIIEEYRMQQILKELEQSLNQNKLLKVQISDLQKNLQTEIRKQEIASMENVKLKVEFQDLKQRLQQIQQDYENSQSQLQIKQQEIQELQQVGQHLETHIQNLDQRCIDFQVQIIFSKITIDGQLAELYESKADIQAKVQSLKCANFSMNS